jgi:hypothetical protein
VELKGLFMKSILICLFALFSVSVTAFADTGEQKCGAIVDQLLKDHLICQEWQEELSQFDSKKPEEMNAAENERKDFLITETVHCTQEAISSCLKSVGK